tara:strand:+ start:3720 stop:4067 length:348 start_codon:yes stop_codon:yes gene_type:complete
MATPKSGKSAPHTPTIATRAEVGALVSFGNTQEQIADHLGINVDTLSKYYREELDNSVVRANAKVAAKLFRKATEGDDLSAMIFWLKTRAKWREKDDEGVSNKKLVEMLIDKLVE